MADVTPPLAPAVISEPELDRPSSPRAQKRRQSSSPSPSAKRARLSTEVITENPSSTTLPSPHASPLAAEPTREPANLGGNERRKSNAQEERKRGQRLFGGLLNTLSQSASNAQQKKRLEIEKRQQEKARLQKAEDESRRAEKLQKLKEVRTREQVKFDQQTMRFRHSNMLAMAQFLCTKTEPKLYYKPWELLPGDEDRIKKQVAEAEALIEREVQEFKQRHNIKETPADKPSEETVGEHQVESSSVPAVAVAATVTDSTNPNAHAQLSQPSSHMERDPSDENGEVLVEAEEDMVIY